MSLTQLKLQLQEAAATLHNYLDAEWNRRYVFERTLPQRFGEVVAHDCHDPKFFFNREQINF